MPLFTLFDPSSRFIGLLKNHKSHIRCFRFDDHVFISINIKLSFMFCSFADKGKEKRLRFKNRTGERGKLSLPFSMINVMINVLMEN